MHFKWVGSVGSTLKATRRRTRRQCSTQLQRPNPISTSLERTGWPSSSTPPGLSGQRDLPRIRNNDAETGRPSAEEFEISRGRRDAVDMSPSGLSRAPARCPICRGASPLTDEDIAPQWARRHLIELLGVEPRKAPPRIKVRICRACNGRLGRLFEQNASALLRPVFEGRQIRWDMNQQVAVGAWVTKTALLGCLAGALHPEATGPLTSHSLEAARRSIIDMMCTKLPPVQTAVFLGRLGHPSEAHSDAVGPLLPEQGLPPFSLFSCSTMGGLVWEMVLGTDENVLPYVSWADRERVALKRVWPPVSGSFDWPPDVPLTASALTVIRQGYLAAAKPGVPAPWRRTWRLSH